MDSDRIRLPLLIGAVVVALLIGLLMGGAGIADRLLGTSNPRAIATASLESMREQNRLIAFDARYVSVTTARHTRLGLSTERTLIIPGNMRYELDLSRLSDQDVDWDGRNRVLTVRLPDIEIAGPELDLAAAREYGSGGLLAMFTDAGPALDRANRAAAVEDLRKQAQTEVPMRLARDAARRAVERSFAMPLRAAGFDDVRVIARFASEEETTDPSYIDHSRSYNEVLEEAREKRAREGSQ